MAIVYEAEQSSSGRTVALKMMSHRLVYEPEVLARFRREADLAATLHHRNIAELLGYGATIFYFFRKHYSTQVAFVNALVFITCGRVLFWDSMLALIDICFSWVVFCLFLWVYHFGSREKFLAMGRVQEK